MLFKRIWHLDDGRQFGVLEGLNLYTWLTDERLAAEIGWEIPQGAWSIAEFESLVERVIVWNETKGNGFLPSGGSGSPITVGRKNWLFSDTPGGAQASATIYTMVEMAKAHKLNVEKYLTFLLTQRPQTGMSDEELEKLVPWSDEARAYCGYARQTAFI